MHLPDNQFNPVPSVVITDTGQMLKSIIRHGKPGTLRTQLINGNPHIKAALFQNILQIIRSFLLRNLLIPGLLYLPGIPGHRHKKTVIHIFNQLPGLFRDFHLRYPNPLQI